MMTFQVESVSEVIAEMETLNLLHWKEIATHKHIKKLNPDYDRYYTLEDLGMLRIYTARYNDELVGYFISMLAPHMHYRELNVAVNDILYILPAHRGSTCGYRLIKGAILDLKNNTDTQIVCIHMKVQHPFRPLLKKLGFDQTEENWEVQL